LFALRTGTKAGSSLFSLITAPARRDLERDGVTTLQQLAKLSEVETCKLHGMRPSAIPKFCSVLKVKGPAFKNKSNHHKISSQ
jgi:hypothetical protein